MADFVQTMKDWRRMCQAMERERPHDACCGCRLEGYGCPAIYEDNNHVDFGDVEKNVTAWAAEHPEPVYPTWENFLEEVGLGEFVSGTARLAWLRETHIPADIAEKLGLQPKEVER